MKTRTHDKNQDKTQESQKQTYQTNFSFLKKHRPLPTSYTKYLSHKKLTSFEISDPDYPLRENRYAALGWDYQHQDCYTDDEKVLLQKIIDEYQHIFHYDTHTPSKHFQVQEEKKWYDWWSCTKPADKDLAQRLTTRSFTLPNHDVKEEKVFPLFGFANNLAKKMANWQSQRIKNQKSELINDPIMLVYNEFRDWFYHDLAKKESKDEIVNDINKRQSLLKRLNYIIPRKAFFLPDRYYFNELLTHLESAKNNVISQAANQQLPQLLSALVNNGKNLESHLATNLHFLLIDEPVADNFSFEELINDDNNLHQSPINKIYQNIKSIEKFESQILTNEFNPFFQFTSSSNVKLNLDLRILNGIKFASFVTDANKLDYLKTMAILIALINIRNTFEKFHAMQTKLGSYYFAKYYLDAANTLASNYIALIKKSNFYIKKIYNKANFGKKELLKTMYVKPNNCKHFENNFDKLELIVNKDKNTLTQIDMLCANTEKSIDDYKKNLSLLVCELNTGQATEKINAAMNELYNEINYLNHLLPLLLEQKSGITIEKNALIPTGDSHLPLQHDNQNQEFSDKDNNHHVTLFDEENWDLDVKIDPLHQQPIFTLRAYKDKHEVGRIAYYGIPRLCRSEDGLSNNIIEQTGIYQQLIQSAETPVCDVFPPTWFETLKSSITQASINGALRGGANILNYSLNKLGISQAKATFLSEISIYSYYFITNYLQYCEQMNLYDGTCNSLQALKLAAWETGSILLINTTLTCIHHLLNNSGRLLISRNPNQQTWSNWLGQGLVKISSLTKYSLFAMRTWQHGVVNATSALAAGTASGMIVEKTGVNMVDRMMGM